MWTKLQRWVKKFERPLTLFVGSICLTALLINLDFHYLEANLYDLRMARGYQQQRNKDIVLITLDDKTTKEFDDLAPLSLDFHSRFLEALEEHEPRAVGYLVDMTHVFQANPDLFQNKWPERFIHSARRMERRGTIFLIGTPFDVTGEVLLPEPINSLSHSVAVVHKDGNVFSEDKITRRALLTLYGRPAFHLDLARRLGYIGKNELPRGNFYVPDIDGKYFFFRYHGSTVLNPKTHDISEVSYPIYSFSDITKKRIPIGALKNKILLVGTLSSDDSSDFAFTPYSKSPFANPKIIVHANILNSIINNNGIIRVPNIINWLATLVVTTTVLWWIMTSTPLYGVFATLSLAFAFILISQVCFQLRGFWIRASQPLVGIFVGYYLAVPYRLIREYKTRWDYQRKNELLTQVEELKTNFLNLVTHDLKTPVARIQGLAEVLRRTAWEKLTQRDHETIQHIMIATEELNHFISSILELSKVESNHLQLKFESKDINQLIEKSLERFRAQARARQITIESHLEPLFPIKIDASLISKVLNNLIDNALKYSPPGSKIEVESKEENDLIVIYIKDSGIGMTDEERQNLFTRFYRAKNDLTTAIAGTGLGLYLTKYFIEAHKGTVSVESEKNKGSTFKISLPIHDFSKKIENPPSLTQGLAKRILNLKLKENENV